MYLKVNTSYLVIDDLPKIFRTDKVCRRLLACAEPDKDKEEFSEDDIVQRDEIVVCRHVDKVMLPRKLLEEFLQKFLKVVIIE